MASPEQKRTMKSLNYFNSLKRIVNYGSPRVSLKQIVKKNELVAEFQGKFTIDALKRTFHSLKACFTWESKKYGDGEESKKP